MKMKSTFLLAIIIAVPMLTLAQFAKKDQKAVKKYTKNICNCTKELVNTLDPTALQYLRVYFDEGEEKASEFLNNFVDNSSSAEVDVVKASFAEMSGDDFLEKIEACDDKEGMDKTFASSIDNMSGEAYDYFLSLIAEESSCYWFKNLYESGQKAK